RRSTVLSCKQHGLAAPPLQPQADSQAIIGYREVLADLAAHIGQHVLLPEPAATVRSKDPENWAKGSHGDAVPAGQQVVHVGCWTLEPLERGPRQPGPRR